MSNHADRMTDNPEETSRSSMRIIERSVTEGWDVPSEWKAKLPKVAAKIATDDNRSDRDRLRALEVLRAMDSDRVKTAIELNKLERLDAGQATDRIETIKFVLEKDTPPDGDDDSGQPEQQDD